MLLTTQVSTAEAATLCGENYHSVGKGRVDLVATWPGGSVNLGYVDIQYNPVQTRWCFLVKANESISFVTVHGAYGASPDWDRYGEGRGWKVKYLDSNGGECAKASAKIAQVEGATVWSGTFTRCR
ncbi:hypothetical protein [Kribbella sindirgiensis]|uniref:Uncharacterized protein n=1 Tax=Kribbella sindirgiensis TaxID=1124744 RepID=A0A4R0J696_9ACTN|nr:hypothetical protein [Kribbella sindirgiensis]TCC39728.1 hypothetical protein E0H50_07370 [Kribbella sindirgiensis]